MFDKAEQEYNELKRKKDVVENDKRKIGEVSGRGWILWWCRGVCVLGGGVLGWQVGEGGAGGRPGTHRTFTRGPFLWQAPAPAWLRCRARLPPHWLCARALCLADLLAGSHTTYWALQAPHR